MLPDVRARKHAVTVQGHDWLPLFNGFRVTQGDRVKPCTPWVDLDDTGIAGHRADRNTPLTLWYWPWSPRYSTVAKTGIHSDGRFQTRGGKPSCRAPLLVRNDEVHERLAAREDEAIL